MSTLSSSQSSSLVGVAEGAAFDEEAEGPLSSQSSSVFEEGVVDGAALDVEVF